MNNLNSHPVLNTPLKKLMDANPISKNMKCGKSLSENKQNNFVLIWDNESEICPDGAALKGESLLFFISYSFSLRRFGCPDCFLKSDIEIYYKTVNSVSKCHTPNFNHNLANNIVASTFANHY